MNKWTIFSIAYLIFIITVSFVAIGSLTKDVKDLEHETNTLKLEKSILQQEIRSLQGQNNFLKSQNAMLMELAEERGQQNE